MAAIGFSTISPLTEELFFRGALLRSFEYRFSALAANLVQGFLFGFIHLAYFWLTEFNLTLIITMIPFITLAGMLYGWITQETKPVISSMIVHAFCNFVLIFAVYAFIIPVMG
ncbi:MAG: CPBP family intramembrane glutamic endopeptidase [Bacillota bacterium]